MLRPVVGMSTSSSISVVEFVVQPDLFSNSSLTLVERHLRRMMTEEVTVSRCSTTTPTLLQALLWWYYYYYWGFYFILCYYYILLLYDDVLYILLLLFLLFYYYYTQFGVPKQLVLMVAVPISYWRSGKWWCIRLRKFVINIKRLINGQGREIGRKHFKFVTASCLWLILL